MLPLLPMLADAAALTLAGGAEMLTLGGLL